MDNIEKKLIELRVESKKKAQAYLFSKKQTEIAKKALDVSVKEIEELENKLGYNAPALYPDKFTKPKEEYDPTFYLEYDASDPTCNLPVPDEDEDHVGPGCFNG